MDWRDWLVGQGQPSPQSASTRHTPPSREPAAEAGDSPSSILPCSAGGPAIYYPWGNQAVPAPKVSWPLQTTGASVVHVHPSTATRSVVCSALHRHRKLYLVQTKPCCCWVVVGLYYRNKVKKNVEAKMKAKLTV